MQDGVAAAGSAREHIKRLWKSYFANPSQWLDLRDLKTSPKAPDFQHRTTSEFLWLDRTRNPSWVVPLLKKRDRERSSLAFPPPALHEGSAYWSRYMFEKEEQEHVSSPTSVLEEGTTKANYISWLKHTLENEEQEFPMPEENTQKKKKKKKKQTAYEEFTEPTMLMMPSEKPKQKKVSFSNRSASRSQTVANEEHYPSGIIFGRVCDWHSLSLEDTMDALEKGSFSEPSLETLVYIVCKCTQKKDLGCALRLLAYLQRNGLDSHRSLGNYLVSMLVEVESMSNAQEVFGKLVSRSECTWNALIKGFVKSGNSSQAIALYKSMRNECSVHLSGYTFVALLKACTTLKDLDAGRQVHADIIREGFLKKNLFVGNALLDMYAKCGSFEEAQDLFDMLPLRDVVTWTSLIAGYAKHGRAAEAVKCFEQMEDSGVSPNAFTFACVLKACGSLKYSILGREIHAKVQEGGFLETSQIVGNALIDMYAKCGMLEKALEIFNLLPSRDVVSWNALITGYTEHERSMEALACFKRMRCEDFSPNAITFACSLKACASMRALEIGKDIHAEIVRKRLLKRDLVLGSSLVGMYVKCGLVEKAKAVFDKLPVRDSVAWTAMIGGYVQHDAGEKALLCFKEMQAKGVSPDAITYAFTLKACGSIGAIDMGIGIHNQIAEKGFLKRDPLLNNALVDMYTKFGMLAKAQELFFSIQAHDVASCTALITGYAQIGDAENAFWFFNKMRENCVNPTSVTLLSILNACGNAGLVDVASACLEAMSESFAVTTTLEHIACMADLLGRIGQLNRAVALILNAPFHPNTVLWLALLGACQKWGHVEIAREAFDNVMLLDEGEASAYICMSNIYADAGLHEDAEAMRVKAKLERAMVYCG